MSYKRKYERSIKEEWSVEYPASENGGWLKFTTKIPVEINIDVDTVPFDHSVQRCNQTVQLLTGAVVTAESAEVAAKHENAKKVAQTVVNGFFSYIQSDLSQQITELKAKVESLILVLRIQMDDCIKKQDKVCADFNRISSRYKDVFDTLNDELRNRIIALDKRTFSFIEQLQTQAFRTSDDALVSSALISSSENTTIRSIIYGSGVKNRAKSLLTNATNYLVQNAKLKASMSSILINDAKIGLQHVPTAYFETLESGNGKHSKIYAPDSIDTFKNKSVLDDITNCYFSESDLKWTLMSEEKQTGIQTYFLQEMQQFMQYSDGHNNRITHTIKDLWNQNKSTILSNNN